MAIEAELSGTVRGAAVDMYMLPRAPLERVVKRQPEVVARALTS